MTEAGDGFCKHEIAQIILNNDWTNRDCCNNITGESDESA